jgi:hypothetical protein
VAKLLVTEQLRKAVKGHLLGFNDLARLSGVDAGILSRFAAGDRDVTLETASKISKVLGLVLRPSDPDPKGEPASALPVRPTTDREPANIRPPVEGTTPPQKPQDANSQSFERLKRVQDAVFQALKRLKKDDADLLRFDANERTLTFRFAMYLQAIVDSWKEGWTVDCEYNRDIRGGLTYPKKLNLPELDDTTVRTFDDDATTVFPDVIVHRRGKPGEDRHNFLVVELKKSTASKKAIAYDMERKLPAYVKELCYQHAMFVLLKTKEQADYSVTWIYPPIKGLV